MSRILAIDPGNVESGWCIINADTREPLDFGKAPNDEVLRLFRRSDVVLAGPPHCVVIEMIGHYGTGMPAGKSVFDTCVWVGRFHEATAVAAPHASVALVYRQPVKVHHCHSAKAKDSNIRHALVDRFAPGQPNHGKGTKADPGWFYGFRADIWQAYALAVFAADTNERLSGEPTHAMTTTTEGTIR